jgi:hypothetical protein
MGQMYALFVVMSKKPIKTTWSPKKEKKEKRPFIGHQKKRERDR